MVIWLEQGANLHMAQRMPLPLTVCHFSKIQIGFSFLVPALLGSPGKRAVKRVCVCLMPGMPAAATKLWRCTSRSRGSDSAGLRPAPGARQWLCRVWLRTFSDAEHSNHSAESKSLLNVAKLLLADAKYNSVCWNCEVCWNWKYPYSDQKLKTIFGPPSYAYP